MHVEVLKDEIMAPEQSNTTWVFRVRVNGGEREWRVDSFDLNAWFKDAVGRYPRHEGGDSEKRADLNRNWNLVGPKLNQEASRQLFVAEETGRVRRFLQKELELLDPEARIEEFKRDELRELFELTLKVGSDFIPVRVKERVIRDLFEEGSEEAEQNLRRLLRIALESRPVT